MDEFVSVEEMIDRIKDIASIHINKSVYDMDIAALLGINHLTMSSYKKRNQTRPFLPYIIKFAYRTGIDVMKILF